MDGYAIRVDGPAVETLFRERTGAVGAGSGIPAPIEPGEAVRVMTGAPIPEGADAIVPVEHARVTAGGVLLEIPKMGAHLRGQGEIFRRGDVLLPAGSRLSAEAILLCGTVGAGSIPVWRLPRCSVAATGEEIVSVGAVPSPGQIRNGNGPAIAAALASRGIQADELGPVPDRRDELERFFSEQASELILTTGGVSAGDFDLTAGAARASGFEILFHGVAVKPGKPVAFGTKNGALWFGLPGNPVSAMTSFEVFVTAALDQMDGRAPRAAVQAELTARVRHRLGREAYIDARLFARENRLLAEPLPTRGSHDILCQARRNALIIIPADDEDHREGDLLACLPLREFGF